MRNEGWFELFTSAGSIVTKDVPDGCVVAGNPAKIIYTEEEWDRKIRAEQKCHLKFSEEYTMRKNISEEKKNKMAQTYAYVEVE